MDPRRTNGRKAPDYCRARYPVCSREGSSVTPKQRHLWIIIGRFLGVFFMLAGIRALGLTGATGQGVTTAGGVQCLVIASLFYFGTWRSSLKARSLEE